MKKKKKISASYLVCSLRGFVCVCVCVCLQELKLSFPLSLYMVSEPSVAKELSKASRSSSLGQEHHHLFPLVSYYTLGGGNPGGLGQKLGLRSFLHQKVRVGVLRRPW